MARMVRASLTLCLVISILGAPLAMDQCATSCEMTHGTSAASAPTCHHVSAPAARVGRTPERCGHDHTGTVAIGATDPIRLARSSMWNLVAIAPIPIVFDEAQPHRVDSDASPPAGPGQPALISPLRI
jgi:hypothetical protein